MYKLALMLFSFAVLVGSPANAKGQRQDHWRVTQLSGDARVIHAGLQPVALKVSSEIEPGDTLVTGATGRATLVRGADYIVVAPRSELRLPSTPAPQGFTRVIQNLGTMLFKVRHTGIPHFAVDTPMLAAVVKGTTFTVVVDQQRSAVQVIQGAVEVSAVEGGMSRLVEGGRTVFIDHINPKALRDADKPMPAPSSPSSTSVNVSASGDSPLASIAELTGGLVRADVGSTANPRGAPPIVVATAVTPTPNAESTPEAAPVAQVATATPAVAPVTTVSPAPVQPGAAAPPGPVPVVATPAVTAPSVTLPGVVPPTVTLPAVATPSVAVPVVATPTVTTPPVTVPGVTVPPVTVPSISIGSNSGPGGNSGPGSMWSGNSGGNSGPGSMSGGNSGPGSMWSGSSGGNSGPGSMPSVTAPTITTPPVTLPLPPPPPPSPIPGT